MPYRYLPSSLVEYGLCGLLACLYIASPRSQAAVPPIVSKASPNLHPADTSFLARSRRRRLGEVGRLVACSGDARADPRFILDDAVISALPSTQLVPASPTFHDYTTLPDQTTRGERHGRVSEPQPIPGISETTGSCHLLAAVGAVGSIVGTGYW